MSPERYSIKVTGIVQGVGFRPFVYNLAKELFLNGWIINTGGGVEIEIEGLKTSLDTFMSRLRNDAPPLALISNIIFERLPYLGYNNFKIENSKNACRSNTLVSPDISVCQDCIGELFDTDNFRFGYPFVNCTNCGPRFTIIKDMPYDRPNTTMDSFTMCDKCRSQYENPADRRYHAQPVSCPDCGPKLNLLDRTGSLVTCEDAADKAAELLANGYILAVKGLGGYHLACDAANRNAVAELRYRKHRDEKPFALMAKDMEEVCKHCYVDTFEKELLNSVRKPVVLLKKRKDSGLPPEIAPGNPYLGVMLPYTPLHFLLFAERNGMEIKCPGILVMTSGNMSSEPICFRDAEVLEQLGGIADYFLVNDREIFTRIDDSVTRTFRGKEYLIRRARGYAPMPVICNLAAKNVPSVLACGGETKNTFCLNKGNEFYLSPHIGDLENLETIQSFEEGINHYKKLFGIKPEIIAYDLHPEYLSSKYAADAPIKRKIGIQHHKAHVAACMADNNLKGDVIGAAFDGTGFGEDGKIWGGEFFTGSYGSFKRAAHLEYVRMPGGSLAIHEPWRMAGSYMENSGIDMRVLADMKPLDRIGIEDKNRIASRIEVVKNMIYTGFNSPFTSAVGRLFDAVSALAGLCYYSGFEGQAAMELEFSCEPGFHGTYPYEIYLENGVYLIKTSGIINGVLRDRHKNIPSGIISSVFHETVATIINEICCRLCNDTGFNKVVLSGGVFQNMLLLASSIKKLELSGLEVFIHKRVPANDGGLSLGQSVIAMAEAGVF